MPNSPTLTKRKIKGRAMLRILSSLGVRQYGNAPAQVAAQSQWPQLSWSRRPLNRTRAGTRSILRSLSASPPSNEHLQNKRVLSRKQYPLAAHFALACPFRTGKTDNSSAWWTHTEHQKLAEPGSTLRFNGHRQGFGGIYFFKLSSVLRQ